MSEPAMKNDEKDNTEWTCDEKWTEGNILHCMKTHKTKQKKPMEKSGNKSANGSFVLKQRKD